MIPGNWDCYILLQDWLIEIAMSHSSSSFQMASGKQKDRRWLNKMKRRLHDEHTILIKHRKKDNFTQSYKTNM